MRADTQEETRHGRARSWHGQLKEMVKCISFWFCVDAKARRVIVGAPLRSSWTMAFLLDGLFGYWGGWTVNAGLNRDSIGGRIGLTLPLTKVCQQ